MTDAKILQGDFSKKATTAPGVVSFEEKEHANNIVSFADFKSKKDKDVKPAPSPTNIEKLQHFSKLMDIGLTRIVVNSTHRDVIVPDHLRNTTALLLNFSHKFNIPDMTYDANGVSATLGFGGEKFHTTIPWKYVWQIFCPNTGPGSMKVWQNEMVEEKPVN